MLNPPKLLISKRDYFILFSLFSLILSIRFLLIYSDYRLFIDKEFYFTDATILNIYPKKRYRAVKLYSGNLDLKFFSRFYGNSELKIGDIVRVKLYPNSKIKFIDYLKTIYIKSKIISIKGSTNRFKNLLLREVSSQHTDRYVKEFYKAIFFANPISKEFRGIVSTLGISHLIALSGFHLGIIFGFLFSILNLIYKIFQEKFFPYRYNLLDIGVVSILILGLFLYLTDSPPSLVRAYIMFIVGWLALILGLEVKSFELLLVVILVVLAIFPKLLLSIAFWLSVTGVFYIFLILKYIDIKNRYLLAIVVSILIFILILPIIHLIFPTLSKIQLISPILSTLFTLFYPLSIILHLFNMGDIFDKALIWLFNLNIKSYTLYTSPILGAFYIIISFGAVFNRWIFYLLLPFSIFIFF